jgi:catechol 2,3-dioxygenase-like lactoylglutathione lyase family enzyme
MDQRVSFITLGVADLGRAIAFYGALGWRKAPESQSGIAFYQLRGQVLGLFPLDDLAQDQGRPGAALGFGAMTLAQNFVSPAEVDRAYAEALAAGAGALKRPERVFWGGYSGYFADPDGHTWEFAHNPFFPLGADGSLTLPSASPKED